MDKKDTSIGQSTSLLVLRSIYGNWWVLPGCLYTFGMMAVIFRAGAPIAQAVGFDSTSFEGLLFDISVLILFPMGALMWWHVRKHNKQLLKAKQHFLETHRSDRLVVSRFTPLQVYKVVEERGRKIEVVPVWDADGASSASEGYSAEAEQFSDFDAEAFLKR